MDVTLKGRGIELTDALKQAAHAQLVEPAASLFTSPAASIDIELSAGPRHEGAERFSCRVHMTAPQEAEAIIHEHDDDLYKAIHLAQDRLMGTARKQKDKHHDRHEVQKEAARHRANVARSMLTTQNDAT